MDDYSNTNNGKGISPWFKVGLLLRYLLDTNICIYFINATRGRRSGLRLGGDRLPPQIGGNWKEGLPALIAAAMSADVVQSDREALFGQLDSFDQEAA